MTNKLLNRETGDLGERIACKFLTNKGFSVIERNFWRKWGEIDIVARQAECVHFVEVKSVSHETITDLQTAVARRTWRPEEQVHAFKLKQIHKALETWVSEQNYVGEWQIDVVSVRIVRTESYAQVKMISNVVT